jgi:small GTP-binding protein
MPGMSEQFSFDVFLSHSSMDKAVVRDVANRLRTDGLRVWFDEWVLRPGDSIPAKIEEALEHSRVLVLCMSANAFGSDWAQLEAGTFRFRDPLNKERRFIPLRLDEAPIKGSLAQFLYIDWLSADRELEYAKLLETCRLTRKLTTEELSDGIELVAEKAIQLDCREEIWSFAFSLDGMRALTGGRDSALRLWDLQSGGCLSVLEGDAEDDIWSLVWSSDQQRALSGSMQGRLQIWDVEARRRRRPLKGHAEAIWSVAWSADQRRALSGSEDMTVRLWDLDTKRCLCVLEGHEEPVLSVAWSADQRRALSGSEDMTVRLWDLDTKRCLCVLEGHTDAVRALAWTADPHYAVSGSNDATVRLWNLETGYCEHVFQGHIGPVLSVACGLDGRCILSGSVDGTARLWDVNTGRCLCILPGHIDGVKSVSLSTDRRHAFSGDYKGGIRIWDLSGFLTEAQTSEVSASTPHLALDQVQYTNAKVLLVGESGVGKTGLSKRLASNVWEPTDSTVGAWATQWKLPTTSDASVEREIWLWDFGGQADQRLIHQLYMDETALAVLVFDGQKEDLFETLGQWDRDLTRASRRDFSKLLVAGRVDTGGLRVSRSQIEAFKKERGYLDFLETSAKSGLGCLELKQAILSGIRWGDIPWRSSPRLFKRLKDEIIKLKEDGRILIRFNELRETLQMRLSGERTPFVDEELQAVVRLLASPGVLWDLKFGSWVLLQPEQVNAYAQAVIQTLRADEDERGCIAEERVLNGDLTFHRSEERLSTDEERFVLLAMHKILVERGLCLREHTDSGTMLIFPSYYRRERLKLVDHPAVLLSYRFSGFLDDIYATMVVRLHYTTPFRQDKLWRYAADFKTLTGKQIGLKLERRAEGEGELVVYADPTIADAEKIIFCRYIHEHILKKSRNMMRLRHYCCPHCGTPVGNREVAMERLNAWIANRPPETGLSGKIKSLRGKPDEPTIICSKCEKRVPLWDDLEQYFASDEVRERVQQLQAESDLILDSESKDRALVGEVISTVALAGQIIEEYSTKRFGLDMEIEFKDDEGKPTGKKLYLQLKSGDSHLRRRQTDGAEIFPIHHKDHAAYWMNQAYPVFLVISDSKGEVRWMEIRNYLRRVSYNGHKLVKHILFEGERFDVMSVRRWREKILKEQRS